MRNHWNPFLALTALLLVCAAGCTPAPAPNQEVPPQASSPEPQVVLAETEPSARAAAAAQVRPARTFERLHLVGFGDSVTRGYCATEGRSYFELLADNDDAFYPDWRGRDLRSAYATLTVDNQAFNGATSCDYAAEQIAAHLAADPRTDGPTAIVVTIGGNDLIDDYSCERPRECASFCATTEQAAPWADAFEARLTGFIEAAQSAVDGPLEVFVATIYDPTDGVGDIENSNLPLPPWPDGLELLDTYNRIIVEVAEATGAHVVDNHQHMLGHGIHHDDPGHPRHDAADPSYWYCENLEDPNDAGYHAIRARFWATFEQAGVVDTTAMR